MNHGFDLDLIALLPGKDDSETLDCLLSHRQKSLGIRPIRYELLFHPRRDPGCFHEAPEVLETYRRRAKHSLVMFDYEGSGQEDRQADDVRADLERRLAAAGWEDRSRVLIIQPELENWVWSDSPEVGRALGWEGRTPQLRDWLSERQFWPPGALKPPRPKETLHAVLREVRTPRSSAIYRALAERVSLERCTDTSFQQFRDLMKAWFPVSGPP
ncbi:MAG: hypothetical protein HYY96_06525 [Candidatus Tectomicrobia bacterium]|nr:hypothetical protein [Candidatus Tectomicrobia bacterium]